MKRFLLFAVIGYLVSFISLGQDGLHAGGKATVYVEDPTGLRVRSGPGVDYGMIENLFTGDIVDLLEGPEQADDLLWWYLRTPSGSVGWAVEYANGIQTLVAVAPTATPPASPTPLLLQQVTVTPYATISAALYQTHVDADFADTIPLFTLVTRKPVYNMAWTPWSDTLAVGAHDGTVAFHNIELHQRHIENTGMPTLHIPTLVEDGPIPEAFGFSEDYRSLVRISGRGSEESPRTSRVTVYFDYWFYEVGGVINDRPIPSTAWPQTEWTDVPVPAVQPTCPEAPIAIIQHPAGTLQAGNPAQFKPTGGDAVDLGNGTGGIAWAAGSPYALIWSAITAGAQEDDQPQGTAEVWNIQTGSLVQRVPHAIPFTGQCGVEARPAALSPDNHYLATALHINEAYDLLLFFALG